MTQILVTKPGTLREEQRDDLRAHGIVVVEAESPQDVRLIEPGVAEVGAGGLLYAAMRALNTPDSAFAARAVFAELVFAEVAAERKRRDGPPRNEFGQFTKSPA